MATVDRDDSHRRVSGTDSLDLRTVVELSHRTDSPGVLSIYLDVRPGMLRAAIDGLAEASGVGRRLVAPLVGTSSRHVIAVPPARSQ